MHGTGNDFIVVEQVPHASKLPALCDRNYGVGADGVLVVNRHDGPRIEMVVYNADGSRPEMCGNGLRCVAWYAHHFLDLPTELTVQTDAGPRRCRVRVDEGTVEVDMGPAVVGDESISWSSHDKNWQIWPVDVGNPHAVVLEPMTDSELESLGHELNAEGSPFADGVNLERVRVMGSSHLEVDVYERGVGRTMACGTGACAAAKAAETLGLLESDTVEVVLEGGALSIRLESDRVWMTGPVEHVFDGELMPRWYAEQG